MYVEFCIDDTSRVIQVCSISCIRVYI